MVKGNSTVCVFKARAPLLVVHGGAGSYLATTTIAQRRERGERLTRALDAGFAALEHQGARAGVLEAIGALELDPAFNAGVGGRLQADGVARLSASVMDGVRLRIGAVYNAEQVAQPSRLAAALVERGDRNLDTLGAAELREELGFEPTDVRTSANIARWEALLAGVDVLDRDSAIGDAGGDAVKEAVTQGVVVPEEFLPPEGQRHGTVGAVALDVDGQLWAATSTGGRGHERVGRISDSPTPAGNYACEVVALSATGFGEQILDLNLCGRIATRMIDGMTLSEALHRTWAEVERRGALLGVIGVGQDGHFGYAHSTEACGVAWRSGDGSSGLDRHSRA